MRWGGAALAGMGYADALTTVMGIGKSITISDRLKVQLT